MRFCPMFAAAPRVPTKISAPFSDAFHEDGAAQKGALIVVGALMLGAIPAAAAAPGCGGGMVLPGTSTCVRLGVVVRAEAAAGSRAPIVAPVGGTVPGAGRGRAAALRAGSRVDLDARVPTAAGPIRAYLSVGAGEAARR